MWESKVLSKRIKEIDYIKVLALFFVFGVHYISWNQYFTITNTTAKRIISIALYQVFHCCVPLFFISTGYLLYNRKFGLRHYMKIYKVILMYLIASIICGVYKLVVCQTDPIELIKGIGTFSTASYAWYVKYYIILYAFIPLINHLMESRYSNLLVALLIVLSTIGSYGRYMPEIEGGG